MNSQIRLAGQWVKRQHLLWRLALAKGEERKRVNAVLNWKEFWQKRTRLTSMPRHVQIGTNWTCNLKCNFCRLTQEETQARLRQLPRKDLEISDAVLETVLELLPYPEMITLTPLGEPLLYSKIGVLLERHRQLESHNLALTTNANLIDDERARMIVEGGLAHLFVSIDAVTPDLYSQMRVRGSIEKVEAALESINRWKEILKTPFPTMTLAATFLARNLSEMPRLLDFALKHKFNSYSIQVMEIENEELAPEFIGNHLEMAKEMVLTTLARAEGKPIEISLNLGFRSLLSGVMSPSEMKTLARFMPDDNGMPDETGVLTEENPKLAQWSTRGKTLIEKCHYPWYFLLIDTDGEARPCCWAAISWGNLNRSSLDEVWNSPAAIQMREHFLQNHIPKGCQNKSCRVELFHTGTLE